MSLETIRLQLAEILATPLIVNKFIEIDLWSFVHFLAGIIIIIGLFKYKFVKKYRNRPLAFAFIVITLYELVEMLVWSNPITFNGFIPEPETPINQVWDIIIGMLGAKFQLRGKHGFNNKRTR